MRIHRRVKARGARKVRIAVVGLRGIPGVQGGIEAHAQSLYPLLVRSGFDVTVHARRSFIAADAPVRWQGVHIDASWSPAAAGVEALVHTAWATLRARWQGAHILHVHGIGPALLTPLARLLGFRVVVTHHGKDYARDKWGPCARWLLRVGEQFAVRYAHRVICVSRNDAERLNRAFGAGTAATIPNGVPRLAPPNAHAVLDALALTRGRYLLNVARHVPEKRQLQLIAAFARIAPTDCKLVLVGSAQHASDYAARIEQAARAVPGCVLAGQRSGSELSTLYAHAAAYVLPSAHEGFSISLLEAMSFGLDCIASDIPANREIGLPDSSYFALDDVDGLVGCMTRAIKTAAGRAWAVHAAAGQQLQRVAPTYRWEAVAVSTARLLDEVAGRNDRPVRSVWDFQDRQRPG